jgi:hypothetical protein
MGAGTNGVAGERYSARGGRKRLPLDQTSGRKGASREDTGLSARPFRRRGAARQYSSAGRRAP